MSGPGATPLFVDTSAFYARFVENVPEHDRSMAAFDGIRDGSIAFRPLYTSGYVLAELATLLLRKAAHDVAIDAVERVRRSDAVSVLHPGPEAFAAACRSFGRFDDQQISFTDHANSALAAAHDVEHVRSTTTSERWG